MFMVAERFATLVSCRQTTKVRCCSTMSLTTLRRARLFRPRVFQMSIWLALIGRQRVAMGLGTLSQHERTPSTARPRGCGENSSRRALRLDEEIGSAKVSWNLVAMVVSGMSVHCSACAPTYSRAPAWLASRGWGRGRRLWRRVCHCVMGEGSRPPGGDSSVAAACVGSDPGAV